MTVTRELVVSAAADLHGHLPDVEPCDVLLLAGDLVSPEVEDDSERSRAWLSGEFAAWLSRVPAAEVIAIAGNHDYWAQDLPVGVHPHLFKARWTYLQDATLTAACGLTVHGSPWTVTLTDWAFGTTPRGLTAVFELIPRHVDVLLAHAAPHGCADQVLDFGDSDWPEVSWKHRGSAELLHAVRRAEPQLVVHGHIHEGGGERQQLPGTDITVANVCVVDERYELVRAPDMFAVTARTDGKLAA